jgi:broad specificity phosphatase PhoE
MLTLQPMTDLGVEQAKALGRSPQLHNQTPFWRIYSSDLPRTRLTTKLLLQGNLPTSSSAANESLNENDDSTIYDSNDPVGAGSVRFDPRLRELARGARQGLPKCFSYEEALDERQKRINAGEIVESEPIPLLESEDDGWNRALEWLKELVDDVVQEAVQKSCNAGDNQRDGESTPTPMFTVLAVGHGGIYRVFLQRLLGPERLRAHPDANYDKIDGRFALPNASLTILDFHIDVPTEDKDDNVNGDHVDGAIEHQSSVVSSIASIDIVRLMSTEHYGDIREREDAHKTASMTQQEPVHTL